MSKYPSIATLLLISQLSTPIALSQSSTQKNLAHTPASNWPRRDYHHGNRTWEELHPTDKDRGHYCPGNKPCYPGRTCVWKLMYSTEVNFSSYTMSLFYGATVNKSLCSLLWFMFNVHIMNVYCTQISHELELWCMHTGLKQDLAPHTLHGYKYVDENQVCGWEQKSTMTHKRDAIRHHGKSIHKWDANNLETEVISLVQKC